MNLQIVCRRGRYDFGFIIVTMIVSVVVTMIMPVVVTAIMPVVVTVIMPVVVGVGVLIRLAAAADGTHGLGNLQFFQLELVAAGHLQAVARAHGAAVRQREDGDGAAAIEAPRRARRGFDLQFRALGAGR